MDDEGGSTGVLRSRATRAQWRSALRGVHGEKGRAPRPRLPIDPSEVVVSTMTDEGSNAKRPY
ncbi:hypothetical protein, partial [Streptomyces virginiae]|uniref:hypothetical protein n=1 Tax=Streptomyces virginiae TaxID=1961 RepID=UPI003452818C